MKLWPVALALATALSCRKVELPPIEDRLAAEFAGALALEASPNGRVRELEIIAAPTAAALIDGMATKVWAYNGQVPGPTVRIALGDTLRVHFRNELPQPTTIHWHGVRVPNAMDGVPYLTQRPVEPGQTFERVRHIRHRVDHQRPGLRRPREPARARAAAFPSERPLRTVAVRQPLLPAAPHSPPRHVLSPARARRPAGRRAVVSRHGAGALAGDDRHRRGAARSRSLADLVANGATVRGRLLDVSLGGARMLVSGTPAQWGDSVQLLLRTGEPATSVAATVVRTQKTETGLTLGLRFDSLPPESRRLVEALVAKPVLSG